MDAWLVDVIVIVFTLGSLFGVIMLPFIPHATAFEKLSVIITLVFGIAYIVDSFSNVTVLRVLVKKVNKPEVSTSVGLSSDSIGINRSVKSADPLLGVFEVAVIPESSRKMVVFTNNDDLFKWKFNSQAIQEHLEPEKHFIFKVYGFLGNQNILDAEALDGVEAFSANPIE